MERELKASPGGAVGVPSDGSSLPMGQDLYAVVGYFTTPGALFHACESLRDKGYVRFDANTPFPVHGLEKAMGLRRTRFPYLVLAGGVAGLASAFLLAWYTQLVDYPVIVSGKPPFAYQAFVPIFFELMVLGAALAAFFGLWAVNGLPRFHHPAFTHPLFHRATDNLFFLTVEVADPKYDPIATKALLTELGIRDLEEVRS